MIRKNGNIVVDVLSTLGTAWLGLKDKRTFYIKKTITYGSWNIVWEPDSVDDTVWSGGTVHVNAYATRTNTIREGFNYRQETETEYCTITYTPTLTDCELSGMAGEEGYTFTWGEYNITSENRIITLTASHESGTSTKELTQLKRDKYVISIVDLTPEDPNNETFITYQPDIIPASGGRLESVPYTYIVLYNTGETEEKHGILDISDKDVYASSKGVIESEKTIVTTIPGSDLGKLPAIDDITVDFPNLTIYQAENKKHSNNDNKTVTTNVTLSATPTTVYTKGGLITFTTIRTYDSYSDSYTWDSGAITPSDITHNNNEQLSEFPLTYIVNDETNTTPSTNTFNIEEYTEGDRIIPFNTHYIDEDGSKTYSNIVNINQLMDYKIEGSDVYENLNVSLSYSNISDEVPYTFSAAGGSLIMNDTNRVTLTATYIHKWTMVEAGELSEIITKSLVPSSDQQLLEASEYTFNVESYTANNLGTTITPINNNLTTITVTVTPKDTNLTQLTSAILTLQGNTEDSMPIEGSEEAVRLDVTVSPNSVSYEGGDITLEAEYFYTEKHLMTSGSEKIENKQKSVSEIAQWTYKSKTGTEPETLLLELSIGTTSHTISEIAPDSTDNIIYTYYATYNGITGNGIVTQIPDLQIDEYYENLVITNYSYPTINETDYHIANTGGTLIAATWPGKILTATVDHVIVYEKTGKKVLPENVNMEEASVSYSKTQISGDNLGTLEYVNNINKGTIVVTVKVSNGKNEELIDTKESNTIYQLKNAKSLDTREGSTTYKNIHITSPIDGTTVDNGENTITLSLTYDMVLTYLFESGAEKQETTYNIDGTELTTWYVNEELYGMNKNSYTIEALAPTVLEDKEYIFTGKITLGIQEFSDDVTVLQKAKTVLYQKNLTVQISYPVFTEGVTYHIPASGGVAVSSNLRGTYSYIDVYSDGTESSVHTYDIDTLTDSEKVLNTITIEYGSKGTSIASEDLVMFNNALTSPKSFTLSVKPSNVKGQDGTVLTSNSATAIIKQEANEALTGDDNITISYKDFTIQNTNPVSLSNAGGTVNLIAKCTKTTATKYTSGGVKTEDEPNLIVTTDTTWSVNNVELLDGISTYDIEQFSDFDDRTFVIDAEYLGLTDTITIIQTARVLTGEYYKDVALHISYPVFTEGVTYHIPASGGTVDNSKVTGTFEYTKVLTYDDNSEIELTHTTEAISSILNTWKIWDPNTTQDIDSLGTQVKEESNTGKSIKLTISPDSWKDKNGNNVSVSDTVYIIQLKNDNGSTPTTLAYDIYDEVVLTASPTSFNNNGGTCNLTATLRYTSYADTYTWTSGATTGGEFTKNTRNISNETDVVYSAKKNDSNVSLTYTNGTSTKNVNIPSRTAGTIDTDTYVFTVTTTYKDSDGNTLTASTENVIQSGDTIKSVYYENLVISINYDDYILGGNKENSTHYHFAANGKTKSNAELLITNTASKSASITRVDVWEQLGEVRTPNIDITDDGTWTYDIPSVTASNLDTNEIPRTSVKTITATFNSGLVDKTGTVLSGTCSDTLYQEANTALTGADNVVVTWKDFSVLATTPTELPTQGGTVNLSATVTKVTTTTYTSGNKKSIDNALTNVTTLSSWSVNGTSLTAGSTTYTINPYAGKENLSYVFEATYEGLSDDLSVVQLAKVKTGEYYKDLSLTISYPYVAGKTYHVGAEGGTVNNNNVTGIFKYTKVVTYDDGSEEVVIDNKEENISLISDSWKSFTPNSELSIDPRGILEASEGNTGKSISLTVSPTGWKLKNGNVASASSTVNIIQQGNSSSVFKAAYNDYTDLSLTASPNSFNNNGGTCNLTATLYFTHHDTEYVWTSGSHSGGEISYDSKNVSIESGSIYTATKNGSSISLTYSNGTNTKNTSISSRTAGTLDTDTYVFTITTSYTKPNGDILTATSEDVLQLGDTIIKTYYENLLVSINYDSYILSGTKANSNHYHFNAAGKTKSNSASIMANTAVKSATATLVDVWEQQGEVRTANKNVTNDGTWTFEPTSVSANNLGTESVTRNAIQTITATFTSTLKDINNVILSKTATDTIYQQENAALTGSANVVVTYESLSVQETTPTTLNTDGGTVNLSATITKVTTTTYTSGEKKVVKENNLDVTSNSLWTVNIGSEPSVKLPNGSTTYTINAYSGDEDQEFILTAACQGLTDNITITQTARVPVGTYYKDLSLTISYPYVTGKTYHIGAEGGTVNNNNITGIFKYTKVTVYNNNTEKSDTPVELNIASVNSIWKTFNPTSEQIISSRGTESVSEGNTGKSISLTIAPTDWKLKNGDAATVSATTNIVQQGNSSSVEIAAYTEYTGLTLTANPKLFENTGGTCNLTATLSYVDHATYYVWTSGEHSGGTEISGTKNISTETNSTYTATKNNVDTTLTYSNGTNVKNVQIPSRTAGTTSDDTYVFTVTTKYKKLDNTVLTASTENIILKGDYITKTYYKDLQAYINYDAYIMGGVKTSSTHYHFNAAGKTKNNAANIAANTAAKQATIVKVDVWAQLGTKEQTLDITNIGTWSYNPTTINASNLGTETVSRNAIQTITATISTNYKDINGTNLSKDVTDTIYQQENAALSGGSNVVIAWRDLTVQYTDPKSLTTAGGTVYLSAKAIKDTTTTYTSGEKEKVSSDYIDVTSDCSWIADGTPLNANVTTYNVNSYSGDVAKNIILVATYQGLTDDVTITQAARKQTGTYYKDLQLNISYPLITNTTYHISAAGGTVNNNNVTGTFQYTEVLTYDNGTEKEIIHDAVSISTLNSTWKTFSPNTTLIIASRGTEPASEGNTGKSISLTIAPTGWKFKNGTAASVLSTINITQQGNSSSVFKNAYNEYTDLSLTADPATFGNNGGTCYLTAILSYTEHTTEYVWTSGEHSGGSTSNKTKNISSESNSQYSAKKNNSNVTLTYSNSTNSKSVIIPSRTAGTTTDDTYVFTITSGYKTPSGTTLSATSGNVIQEGDVITSVYYENLEIAYNFNNHVIGGDVDTKTHYHFDASGMNGSNESFTAGSGNYSAYATKVTVWKQQGEVKQTGIYVSDSSTDWTFTPSKDTNITASDLGTTSKTRSIIQTVTATFECAGVKDKNGNNLTGSATANVYQGENSRRKTDTSATYSISATPETNTYEQTTITLKALYLEIFIYTWTSGHTQNEPQLQLDVTLNTKFSYNSSDSIGNKDLGSNIMSHTLSPNTSHTSIKTTTYTGTYKSLTDTATVTQSPDSVDTTVNGNGIWYKDISVSWAYPYVSGTSYHVAATGGTKTISNNTSSINTSNGYIPANTYYVLYKKVTRYLSGDVEDSVYTKLDITKLSTSERSFDKTSVTVPSLGSTYESNITNTGKSFKLTVTPSGIKNEYGTLLSAYHTVYLLQLENIYDSSNPVFTSIVVERYDPTVTVYNNSPSVSLTATGTYHYVLTTGASTADETISLHGTEYSTYWKAFKTTSTTAYTLTFTGHDNCMEAAITTRPNGTTGNVNYWYLVVYRGVSSNKLNVVQEGDYSNVSLSNLNISFDWNNYKLYGQNYHFTAQGYLGPDGFSGDGTELDDSMLNKSATATETTTWIYSGVSLQPTTRTVNPNGRWTFKANTLSNNGLTASTMLFASNIRITASSRDTTIDTSQGLITVTGRFEPSDSQLSATTKTYTVYQLQNTRTKKSNYVEHSIDSDTIVTWEGDTVILTGTHWYYYEYTSGITSDLYSENITNTGNWYYYISSSSTTPSTTVSGRVNLKLESIPSKESTSQTYYWTWITYNGLTSTPKYIRQKVGGADRTVYWYKNNSDAVWSDGSTSSYKTTTISFDSYSRDIKEPDTVSTPYGAETNAYFVAWYFNGSDYLYSSFNVSSYTQISLYALWENTRYRITWDAGSGNIFMSTGQRYAYSYVPYGGGYIWCSDDTYLYSYGPGLPDKVGYSFNGFVKQGTTSPTYTSAFYHGNSSDTYIAQYTLITYTITWDAGTNGGTFSNGSGTTTTTATYGTKYYNITRPTLGDPIKYFSLGYYPLSSWNTNKNGAGTSASSTSSTVYGNITFYALYSSTPTYTAANVTYYANGGTFAGGKTEITNTYSYGTEMSETYPANPTRTDYVFDGWYWDQNCTQALRGDEGISSQNLTVYAKWVRTYTVSFIGDDHAHWNPTSVIVREGESGSSVVSYDTGYIQAYVSGYETASGSTYYSKVASSTNTNPTVYAYSLPKLFTVTWYKNNSNVKWSSASTDTNSYKTTLAYYNTAYNDLTPPSILTTQSDSTYYYTLTGWNRSSTGNGVPQTSTTYYVTGSGVSFYAIWNVYKLPTITWNANGGYLSDGSTQKTNTVTLGMPWMYASTPTNPTRTDYVFKGWYNAATGGTALSSITGTASPGAELILYAHWEEITYTPVFLIKS